jgi:hypothetical protein
MANSPRVLDQPGNARPGNARPGNPSGFGATQRTDPWWAQPLAIASFLVAFGIYATWAALQNANYLAPDPLTGPYLSPMYSPLIQPSWWPLSPAFLILWAPGGFRATCYYYRKAYYRSLFLDPAGCAVGESRHSYCGETKFPFILQNLHRFMFYVAVIFIVVLWHDAYKAFFWRDGFHMGVGTLVMIANAFLLSGYTFGCHSFRHLIGGRRDSFNGANAAHGCWMGASKLNVDHQTWALISMFWVGFTDFYIRMVASGRITDIRIF